MSEKVIYQIYLTSNIVTLAHMAHELMEKRIPVSATRWKQLGQLKQAGQTYDELLGEMIQAYNRQELANKARIARLGKSSSDRFLYPLQTASCR